MEAASGPGNKKVDRKGYWLKVAQGAAATGVTAVCLVYVGANTDLAALGEKVWQADYLFVGIALALSALTIVCKGARWRIFYPSPVRPGLGLAVAATAAGQVMNWVAPARLGDLLRVGFASSGSFSTAASGNVAGQGLGVLVAEKLVDIVFLLIAAILLTVTVGLPEWIDYLWLLLVGSASILGIIFVVAYKGRRKQHRGSDSPGRFFMGLTSGFISRFGRYAIPVVEGASAWLTPRTFMQVIVWSVGAWGLGGLVNFFVLLSLNVNHGFGAPLALLVTLYGGAVVPSLPGRIGVFQYLCLLTLTTFGVYLNDAIAVSVVLYVVVYLPPIVLGLFSIVLAGPVARQLSRNQSE